MKRYFVCFVLVIFFAVSALASVVTVEGKSVIVQGNPEKTKELALKLTLKKAVETFVFDYLSKPTADANFEKLDRAIYSHHNDFISKYELVSEREDGQFHYTTLKVEIDDGRMMGQLKALAIQPQVGGKPRVAVIASEQNVDGSWFNSYYYGIYHGSSGKAGGEASFNICEGKLNDVFSAAGYPMVDLTLDPTEVKKAYSVRGTFDRYDDNLTAMPPAEASKMIGAVDNDVTIVVACKALAKDNGKKTMHFNSIGANVSCKATDIKAKRVIATSTGSAMVPHVDPITGGNEALKKACSAAADDLLSKMDR